MYFDVEDHRPDTPRVSRAISLREAILWTLLLHAVLLIAVLLTPPGTFFPTRPLVSQAPAEDIHFVTMAAPTRMAAAKKPAPVAGIEHPTPTPPVPKPDVSHTPTPAPPEPAKGPDNNAAPAPPNATLPMPISDNGFQPDQAKPTGGGLGQSLRNIERYIQGTGSSSAPQGGNADQGGSDFEFDPKGVDFGPWLQRFKAQVMHNWNLPIAAQTQHGHVTITMAIYRDGRITDVKVINPSSVGSFNTSAVNALHGSNPTVPIPKEYPVEPFLLTVTFFYNENIGRGGGVPPQEWPGAQR